MAKQSGWKSASPPPNWKYTPPGLTEVARLDEVVSFTGGGGFAIVLMILHNIALVLAVFGSARSAVQEASLGTIWIAGNVLWGVCILAGRRRNYRVFRIDPPADPPRA